VSTNAAARDRGIRSPNQLPTHATPAGSEPAEAELGSIACDYIGAARRNLPLRNAARECEQSAEKRGARAGVVTAILACPLATLQLRVCKYKPWNPDPRMDPSGCPWAVGAKSSEGRRQNVSFWEELVWWDRDRDRRWPLRALAAGSLKAKSGSRVQDQRLATLDRAREKRIRWAHRVRRGKCYGSNQRVWCVCGERRAGTRLCSHFEGAMRRDDRIHEHRDRGTESIRGRTEGDPRHSTRQRVHPPAWLHNRFPIASIVAA